MRQAFLHLAQLSVALFAAGCATRPAQELFEEGNRLFDAGDAQGALRSYTKAIEAEPGLSRAWNNRGLARMQLGDLSGAQADYAEAIRIGPAAAEAHYNRGIAFLQVGDAHRAVADFDDALRLQTVYPRALVGRGLARGRLGDRQHAADDLKKALETASPDWPERPRVEAELAKLLSSK